MSAEPWSNWKQSGNSAARFRLARKPKLRMRMKPRGSRWRRKRRRNSLTGRVMSRCLSACEESRQRKVTLPCSRATSLRLEMATRWVLAAEIAQRVFRVAEGWLGIDDPVVAEQGSEPCGEGPWFRQCCEVTVEREFVLVEGGLQSGDELAAKDPAEHLHRQEETMARRDPTGVVGSEAASGGHAVDMGMKLEALVPGMEHAEEADLRAQVAGIASELQQGCGTCLEQQVVD